MTEKEIVQVGVTAMRTADGKHLPATPIYILVSHLENNGLTQFENQGLTNVSGFFADKRKETKIKGEIENENKISG
jgi:hypothetical protein